MSEENLSIKYKFRDDGFNVSINKKKFSVVYPETIWQSFPYNIRKETVENYVFLSTSVLPVILRKKIASYSMRTPILKSFFLKPVLYNIPFATEEYGTHLMSTFRRLMNIEYDFTAYETNLPAYSPAMKERAVNLFTFGKDSLLSYCIAKEIGLDPIAIYIEEPDIKYIDHQQVIQNTYENVHKDVLTKKFFSEFGEKIYRVKNEMGLIRYAEFFNVKDADLCWSSQLTEYALMSLPFNHYFKAKYVVFGNEASCSDKYTGKEGFSVSPVYDQTNKWTTEISKLLKILTKKITAMSLIEPIHELAVTKILHSRYPQYAKYQMSCFADINAAKNSRWCHNCSKCARIYVFLLANKVDPKTVGFKESMLSKKKKEYFSLFSKKAGQRAYDLSGLGRDEQMYAFYLAYKNSAKGFLINLFKRKYLDESEKRERELHETYFGIHSTFTIPPKIRKKVLQIYREEL
jgi:hypothetical protein